MLAERMNDQDENERRLKKDFDKEKADIKASFSSKIDKIRAETSETLKNELAKAERDYTATMVIN